MSDYEFGKVVSGSGYSPYEELKRSNQQPGFSAGNRSFKVLGEAAIAVEPSESSLHDPAAWKDFKAGRVIGTLDDFDTPVTKFGQRIAEFSPGISAIGKQMAQPWEQVIEVLDHKHRAVAVLHIGGVDRRANHQAECIGDDVAFAAFDLLAGVVTAARRSRWF